ncbi:MAG: hypothetical protein ABIS39_06755 [Sphingomicrobium sp.]
MSTRGSLALVALIAANAATPAFAQASAFVLVNGTGADVGEVQIRRSGTQDWRKLATAPSAGARGPVDFKDPDCAFDLQATVPGIGPVTWAGVNLCDVKSVVLKRDPQAGAWVDYDE